MGYDRAKDEKFFFRPMKVLITSGIFPPAIGGPARMIERLALDLRHNGQDVSVLTFGKDDRKIRSFDVIRASSKLDFLLKIFKTARKVDLIYTFDLYTAGFISWLVGKVFLRKKLIVRFAGDSAWENASNKFLTSDDILTFQNKFYGLRTEWWKKIRKMILKGADKVVAVSGFMKEVSGKIGVLPERAVVIYNAVDFLIVLADAELGYKIKRKLGLSQNDKLIVTAGRLVPWKGIEGLILALPEIKNKYKIGKVKLLVIGDGHDKNRLEKIVELNNLSESVIFEGAVPLDKIFIYYNLADVFALNSRYEGLSHTLLEVLSQGKPIVASNSGGNKEVIKNEENGLLVEYNNLNQLANAVYRMLVEEKWHSLEFLRQCEKNLDRFKWSVVVEKTMRIFNEVIS